MEFLLSIFWKDVEKVEPVTEGPSIRLKYSPGYGSQCHQRKWQPEFEEEI